MKHGYKLLCRRMLERLINTHFTTITHFETKIRTLQLIFCEAVFVCTPCIHDLWHLVYGAVVCIYVFQLSSVKRFFILLILLIKNINKEESIRRLEDGNEAILDVERKDFIRELFCLVIRVKNGCAYQRILLK